MPIFQKLMTLARGSARQSTQVLLDANALTLFEQEIVDVETTVQKRKRVMSEMILARKQIEKEIETLQQLIAKREQQAHQLLDQADTGDDTLLQDIANDIAQQEALLASLQQQRTQLQHRIDKMAQTLQQAVLNVTRHRRELRLAKAQQVRSSLLAKANHLPEQLSELETTRAHVVGLQAEDIDGEEAWSEMASHMNRPNIDDRVDDLGLSEQKQRAQEILDRLNRDHKKTND